MFDLSTSTKLNVILGLLLALLIFLIVLLCRKGGEGYKEEEAKQLIGAPKDEARRLILLREAALARRLAAAKEKELAAKAN